MRMLHIKMCNSNTVQEIIQKNKNGEFAGHVQIKLSRIPEVPGCSLVVEHITVGRSFSQLSEVEPKRCVVNGDHLSRSHQSLNILKNQDTGF